MTPEETEEEETAFLLSEDLDIAELWSGFKPFSYSLSGRQREFADHLRRMVRNPDAIDNDLGFCDHCGIPDWTDEMTSVQGNSLDICESCYDCWYTCDSCNERYPELAETLSGSGVCNSCLDDRYSYCDHCSGYYPDDDSYEHEHRAGRSCCESPQRSFTIRNDGEPPLKNDTRVTVTLPEGTISTEGLQAIARYLRGAGHYDISYALESLGDKWQTKTGNYPKRLSRLAYKDCQTALPPEVLSQVGCIARDHSTQVDVTIDVTRELNLPPGDFYHEESCWWGSYREARCALKTNGGFGMRSYNNRMSGRAWVLPLKNDLFGKLSPTFATMTQDAFVVFNGYGDLSGYSGARILAHLSGWTYRKIAFECYPMYINAGAYLIAPEDIAEKYTDGSLHLSTAQHSDLFSKELVSA